MKTDHKRMYPHKDFKAKLEITATKDEFVELANAIRELPHTKVVDKVWEELTDIIYWLEDMERMP